MTFAAGSQVKTGPGAEALLTFSDGSTLRLEPDTHITIQRVQSSEQGGAEIVLNQSLGKTWSHVVKRVEPGHVLRGTNRFGFRYGARHLIYGRSQRSGFNRGSSE